MSEWYCKDAARVSERPCLNHKFMHQMKAATNSEDRKKLIKERAATMPSDAESRKKLASSSRVGYLKMYKAYCAQPSPENPEVCTHPTLKKLFDMYEKGAGSTAPAA